MGYDIYKRCKICYKKLDLNDAFSGSEDYCPFCMKLLRKEKASNANRHKTGIKQEKQVLDPKA